MAIVPSSMTCTANPGGSPRGQAFAGRWADTIIASADTVEQMKAFRLDVRKRAVAAGRDPDGIKVLFLAYPIVDTSMEAARDRDPRAAYALIHPDRRVEHRRLPYDHEASAAALRERFDGAWVDTVARRIEQARIDPE